MEDRKTPCIVAQCAVLLIKVSHHQAEKHFECDLCTYLDANREATACEKKRLKSIQQRRAQDIHQAEPTPPSDLHVHL